MGGGRSPRGGGFGTRPIISHNSVVPSSLQRVFIDIMSLDVQGLARQVASLPLYSDEDTEAQRGEGSSKGVIEKCG